MSMLEVLAGAVGPTSETSTSTPRASVDVSVIPYNAVYDPQADSFLHWLWKKMQDDDLVDYYFPGQKDTGFASFVRLFSGDAQVAMFRTEDQSSDKWEDRLIGFITWSTQKMGASDVLVAGFIFFRKWWDHATTDLAAKKAFSYWFENTKGNTILGVCPALHHAAIRYNRRVGLKEIGRIPNAHLYKGTPCDAILYAITREDWEGSR